MLWEHETRHVYSEQGLATRQEPDGLPPVEWLTYGSGYLAGMKLGGTPLVEYTRDRLHHETARSFGGAGSTAGYEQATAYTLTGQLRSRHLNLPQLDREYTWNDNGQLVRISGPQESRKYRYSDTGRLTGVHTTAANLDIDIPYATDPAGNRLPDPELHPDSTFTAWPDNRITEDAHYVYRYDEYGRLAEKTDRIPEGVIRMHDERTHHYHYDSQHRLVFYTRIQHGEPQVESRYLYDPLGRRTGKRVWRRERDLTGWMSLSRKPEETWYGWDGDRLTTVQTGTTRIQTVYQPGSFTPLIRIETENGEQAKARHRSLAEVLQEDTGVTLPAELSVMLGRLERELRAGAVSAESEAWLQQCGLTAEQMKNQMEAEYIPERTLHLYHCDHRGLPQALISPEGETAWQGEYDEWGNLLGETSAQQLQQPYRLPGQQYDEESGLYYNRNRYYDPLQGRYITQDPIGLRGAWNLYQYPLNPTTKIDPLGLSGEDSIEQSGPSWLIADPMDKYRQQAVMGLTKLWDDTFSQEKTKCLPTTPENIRMVVANSPLLTVQQKVSVPVVAHYVQMLEDGSGAPPVDMDGNVIVNGNHRMVAGLLCDKLPPERPGTRPLSAPLYPFSQIFPELDDWGNR
ncbi:Putative deoxyribonuclease RhsC [Escherichia coli]|nr:Putative deoxyribonuclease RhsC [Escherichia coli]